MLDKELCEVGKVDVVEKFFVDYIDDIDDKLKKEKDKNKRCKLKEKKEIIQDIRKAYINMITNKG